MFNRLDKATARSQMRDLVSRFERVEKQITAPTSKFNEAETRSQFVDEFLRILGWDVSNTAGKVEHLADVVLEKTQATDDSGWGRPDYILRMNGDNLLPIEAKKASISFSTNSGPATQARSYGWTLSVPASVLTNFRETRIFDTRQEQGEEPDSDFSLIPGCCWNYKQYVSNFDQLWEYLSYESLENGSYEQIYGKSPIHRGQSSFDTTFLTVFRKWRLTLAEDLKAQCPEISASLLSQRVQKVLNALLFVRVCEDRNILEYAELLKSANLSEIHETFVRKDRLFNAGIFQALEGASFSSTALLEIVKEMYWPYTKFAYGLINSEMLSRIYEQYLAEQIEFDEAGKVQLVEKPEIVHAGGVARTPNFVVEAIVKQAILHNLKLGVSSPRILDFASGSGIFLLEALRQLTAIKVEKGHQNTIELRSKIAREQLFGLDIDGAAVEVTRLSLLLEILGTDKIDTRTSRSLLPDLSRNLGLCNTVVRNDFDKVCREHADDMKVWSRVLPGNVRQVLSQDPGEKFDAVVGNPPYVRIQVLNDYHPEQLDYFQNQASNYVSAQGGNFDLSTVFIERALELASSTGTVVAVVPNRFFTNSTAKAFRKKILPRLSRITDFGVNQVFQGKSTYVCIIELGEESNENLLVRRVNSLEKWDESKYQAFPKKSMSAERWSFVDSTSRTLFEKMRDASKVCLSDVADVFVGVQTSRDDVYFVKESKIVDKATTEITAFDGSKWSIESSILRPAIRDASLSTYDGQAPSDCLAIFPYERTNVGGRLRAKPISPEDMRKKFPKALAYFENFKETLLKRKVSPDPGQAYWAYGRSQSLTKLDSEKILVRVLSIQPSYAIDKLGMIVPGGGDGGPYYLIRSKDHTEFCNDVLQAILCHPIVDRYVTENGKKYRGAYAVHKKAELVNIPLPPLDKAALALIKDTIPQVRELTVKLRNEPDDRERLALSSRRENYIEAIEMEISKAYGIETGYRYSEQAFARELKRSSSMDQSE